jgi:hypothetical protein
MKNQVLQQLAIAIIGLLPAVAATPAPAVDRGHQAMIEMLADLGRLRLEDNRYQGESVVTRLTASLAQLPTSAPSKVRVELNYHLGVAELFLGRERAAIDHLRAAVRILPELRGASEEFRNEVRFRLGVASLRLAETENCCLHYTSDSCILPIQGAGVHKLREGSESAIVQFESVLAATPPDSRMHLSSMWLLNIAYMTLGEHPQGVAARFLISPSAFESDQAFPRFANIAPGLGLNSFSLSGGAVADDFDSDGDLDLLVSTSDVAGQIRLFTNNQDGSFSDRTQAAGLTGITGGLNMVQADYDNDGSVDVLVLRGAWFEDAGQHPNSLLRNNGTGGFTDVTFAAGLGDVHYPTQTAAWADYDNDGDVDLYIGNESTFAQISPCQLFRNNGNGTFTDVADGAGVIDDLYVKGVFWGDYDADHFPDLYVSNLDGPNRLYHNNGDGTFTDVAPQLGVTSPKQSFPGWFWDFDNDGHLDLMVWSYAATIADVAASYLGNHFQAERARLYRGDGHGGFTDVAAERNLVRPTKPMGANFGDLDNDGYLDVYLGTGDTDYTELMPNLMFVNKAGERFADVTTAGGFGNLQKGHGVVFADFDNDGDQDLFEQMGGAYLGDRFGDSFYANPGFGAHWLGIQLIGTRSNRSAIGAGIRVEVVDNDEVPRSIYKHVNSGGTFGANPLRQTIGLGSATQRVSRLEVTWPTTGQVQVFRDVPLDSYLEIVEDEETYTTMQLNSFRFD